MSAIPDILVIDRTTDCHAAILWLAMTGSRIVKYDTTYSRTTIDVISDDCRRFSGRVPLQSELFYGMSFTIPVSNFRLTFIPEGSDPVDVFAAAPGEKVKKIEFVSPIRLAYEKWSYSYETSDGDIYHGFDNTVYFQHRIMDPLFTFAFLRDRDTDTEFQPYSSNTKVVVTNQ